MGTFLNDWMMRRMMSAPSAASNIIYKLYNHTCDGTAATAINTGLYLFDTTLYPNGWDIYFDFTVGEGNGENASYLRCRDSENPYNGFTYRRLAATPSSVQTQANSQKGSLASVTGVRLIATVEKPIANNKFSVNLVKYDGGSVSSISDTVKSVTSPLVIGGELSDDTTQAWNPDRFSKITIHSLVITKKTSS